MRPIKNIPPIAIFFAEENFQQYGKYTDNAVVEVYSTNSEAGIRQGA